MRPSVHQYDPTRFDFVSVLRRIYGIDDLASLAPEAPLELLTWENDQSTDFHAAFYRVFDSEVRDLYREFVANLVPEVLGTKEFCFQRVPTFRVHLPNNMAVCEFHTDADFNHGPGEINFWVPFTRTWGTNTVWVEQEVGRGDYQPAELVPGQVVVFDGVHLRHGNKINDTGSTRVSFDFRCIPMADYAPSNLRTATKRGLWIGEYFDVL